jgi:DNA-binding transcriptional LysR family regulator
MDAKIAAQIAGLGVGYLPRHLVHDARRADHVDDRARRSDAGHSIACLAWRADARGRALDWWIEELAKPAVRAVLLA